MTGAVHADDDFPERLVEAGLHGLGLTIVSRETHEPDSGVLVRDGLSREGGAVPAPVVHQHELPAGLVPQGSPDRAVAVEARELLVGGAQLGARLLEVAVQGGRLVAGGVEVGLERLALAGEDVRILVVDDASPDGTAALAERLGAEVLRRPGKLGLGSAYVAGFARALSAEAELICQLDADGSHDPKRVVPRSSESIAIEFLFD